MKGMSLFANVGIAETLLEKIGVKILLANEIDSKRVKFYKHLYPETEIIEGDITDNNIFTILKTKALNLNIDFIIATPPCQGMSSAGKKDKNDLRNKLVTYAVDMIKSVRPKYVLLENVPQQLKTKIEINGEKIVIPEYIKLELEEYYFFNKNQIINAADYGVPQNRERSIFLLTRKDQSKRWEFPNKEEEKVTLKEAIGHLPELDPLIYDIPYEEHLRIFPEYEKRKERAESISKWHTPPKHVYRQVYAMMHTPTGKSAFENKKLQQRPMTEKGELVKGFKNTYKRQHWDKPAYTVTMYNRTIGSQENVHPGRKVGFNEHGIMLYSDPRVLTVYELMKIMSLPSDWKIPLWATENFVRQVIGEGIPPLLVKKIFLNLINRK